ncbi:restriction endonuclease [bacterium]|nr:restriction endonuclease [bacterium]
MSIKRRMTIDWPESYLITPHKLPKAVPSGKRWRYALPSKVPLSVVFAVPRVRMEGQFHVSDNDNCDLTVGEPCKLTDISELTIKLQIARGVKRSKVQRPRAARGELARRFGSWESREHDRVFAEHFDKEVFDSLLQRADAVTETRFEAIPKDVGDAYEDLVETLLTWSTSLFKVIKRNPPEPKIDILLRITCESPFGHVSDPIVVECKNRADKINKADIWQINDYMKQVRAKCGIIFARKSETRDAQKARFDARRSDSRNILLVTREDLTEIGHGQNLVSVLERKYDELLWNRKPPK